MPVPRPNEDREPKALLPNSNIEDVPADDVRGDVAVVDDGVELTPRPALAPLEDAEAPTPAGGVTGSLVSSTRVE